MAKVIIGIHGLANKPPRPEHRDGWLAAINEGFDNLKLSPAFNPDTQFVDVYWADLMYKNPLHHDTKFSFDDLYDSEPYLQAKPGELKEYIDGLSDILREKKDELLDNISGWGHKSPLDKAISYLVAKKLQDLAFYYDPEQMICDHTGAPGTAQQVLKNELKQVLLKHKDDEILLLAHSMGSIIAYDVLCDLAKSHPTFSVKHLVTLGSPLGIPYVQHRIKTERHGAIRTPDTVSHQWTNIADHRDKVALDAHLHDDFGPNAHKVQVVDDLVYNSYRDETKAAKENPHKIYGYLRTPEVSKLLHSFLVG